MWSWNWPSISRRPTGTSLWYSKHRPNLKEGMCFTIEPMINIGSHKTKLSKNDGWTVETIDGRLSAQWEHTILVTSSGYEVLTLRQEESLE